MAFQYNGGSVLGMSGDNCVCIASDNRYGQNLHTISTDFPKIFKITDKIYLGLSGLATDIQDSFLKHFEANFNVVELKELSLMKRSVFLNKLLLTSLRNHLPVFKKFCVP